MIKQHLIKFKNILKEYNLNFKFNIKEMIFPIVMGYCLTCLIYNYSICSFAWSQNIVISKQYMNNLLLGEFLPVFSFGIIYCRVFSINFLSQTIVKILDIIIYSALCFSVGYIYASFNLMLNKNQEQIIVYYVFLLFAINVVLSVAKEFKVNRILSFFCVKHEEDAVFFKSNNGV